MSASLTQTLFWLVPMFFVTALIYASVGFGGGSTYLALLSFSGLTHTEMPMLALSCNLAVVFLGGLLFIKERDLDLRLVLPFVVSSVPLAYVGGYWPIAKSTFCVLLGISLLVASIRLFLKLDDERCWETPSWQRCYYVGIPIGLLLGFLSGLTGIGGGIYLAPILYFLKWGSAKKIAAASSVFIFVNSLSGICGQWMKNGHGPDERILLPLLLAVISGGILGHVIGFKNIKPIRVQRVTAMLIFFVAVTVLLKQLFS